jgi:hypothetical protein
MQNSAYFWGWGEWGGIHFPEVETKVASKHMKKMFTLLVIRNMKIKITIRYHFIPVRLAKIKKMCQFEVAECRIICNLVLQ